MQVKVAARKIDPEVTQCVLDVPMSEFNRSMDADSVRETLEIILCQDYDIVDIDEEDLYVAAEAVYRAVQDEY